MEPIKSFSLEEFLTVLNNENSFEHPFYHIERTDRWQWDFDTVSWRGGSYKLLAGKEAVGVLVTNFPDNDEEGITVSGFWPSVNCTWGTITAIRSITGWEI